jgi:hypothetical protein
MSTNFKQIFERSIKEAVLMTPLSDVIMAHRLGKELRDWEKRGRPEVLPNVMKQKVVEEYARKFQLAVLVETGTNMGVMVSAMKDNFREIISIELGMSLFRRARRKFKRFGHIRILQGDSAQVLESLLPTLHERCLFWLDAHYSGGITAKGSQETPIVRELMQVLAHPVPGHVILIDDARCFTARNDYPAVGEIRDIVRQFHPEWVFECRQDIMRIHAASPIVRNLPRGSDFHD